MTYIPIVTDGKGKVMDADMWDRCGQHLRVGMYIVYGHALGRCASLRFGKIVGLETWKEKSWHADKSFPQYRITVWGVDDDSNGPPELLSKVSTLMFPDRVIALAGDMLPPNVRKLLDDAPPFTPKPKKRERAVG